MAKISIKRRNKSWLLVLPALLLVLLLGNLFEEQLKGLFYWFSEPLQKSLWQAGYRIDKILSRLFKADLAQENELLSRENQRLWYELSRLYALEEENETLRKALGLEIGKEFRLLLAEVFSGSISNDVLLLNKGIGDGVKEGMPVISEEKVLYGFIKEVHNNYSVLRLLSNPESEVNVALIPHSFSTAFSNSPLNTEGFKKGAGLTDGGIEGEVRGKGGRAILDLIPRTADLKGGELIVTKSFAGKYPQGLLVGFVGETEGDDLSPFRKANVELFSSPVPQKLFIIVDF